MKKVLTKKQKEMQEKKENICTIAISLFKEYGYENTSIRDICKNAHVTIGSLYNLYDNKISILKAYFEEEITEDYFLALEADNIHIDDPLKTITNYIFIILSTFNDLGYEMTLSLHSQRHYTWYDKTEGTRLLKDFIADCQKQHTIISDLSAEDSAEAINTIIYGLVYQWANQKGTYSLIDKAKQFLPILLSGFIYK